MGHFIKVTVVAMSVRINLISNSLPTEYDLHMLVK